VIRPELFALAAAIVASALFVSLAPRWKRVRTRTGRRPSLWAIAFLLAFPATLYWDDYRIRVIVRGADGAFDAVRSFTLAVSAYGAIAIVFALLDRPRPRGLIATGAGLLLTTAAALAAALLSIQ
jgi:hypothetical protein